MRHFFLFSPFLMVCNMAFAQPIDANLNYPTTQDITDNKFVVSTGDNVIGHVLPSNWFAENTFSPDLTCQNPCSTNQINMVGHSQSAGQQAAGAVEERGDKLLFESGFYWDVVTGKNQMEGFSAAYKWMIRRNIYQEIVEAYGTEIPSEYVVFMAEQAKNSVGQFQDLEIGLGKIGQTNPILLDKILALETEIESRTQKWQPELEAFQALSSDEQKKLVENGDFKTLDLGNLWSERSEAYLEFNEQNQQYFNTLQQWNEALPAAQDFEQYEQRVNRIQLTLLQKGLPKEVLDVDAKTLDFIAGLCPFEGGFAVYKARNLYTWLFDTYKLEWFECKDAVEPRIETKKTYEVGQSLDFDIIPNPSADHFYIDIKTAEIGIVHFRLINLTGAVVKGQDFDQNIARIETNAFANGLYLIELTDNKGQKAIKKVFIHH